jgi:hypothetical protein
LALPWWQIVDAVKSRRSAAEAGGTSTVEQPLEDSILLEQNNQQLVGRGAAAAPSYHWGQELQLACSRLDAASYWGEAEHAPALAA